MSKYHLGEFEEIVLLTVAILHGEAYGVAIIEEIESRVNRKVSMGSMQATLRRLEDKSYLVSELGQATSVRGGKRKRFFVVTQLGQQALRDAKEQRMALWNAIPDIAFGS